METIVDQNPLMTSLQSLYQRLLAEDPQGGVRARAWDHFLELGLPDRDTEVFRYVPTKALYQKELKDPCPVQISKEQVVPHILPACEGSHLVFVNGFYQPELSCTEGLPKKVVVAPLERAVRTYSSFLKQRWGRSLKEETDPFVCLNAALAQGGLFVYVPPKVQVEAPVQILHIWDSGLEPMLIQPRLQVFVGSLSELTCVQTAVSLSDTPYVVNQVQDFTVEDGAKVEHLSFHWNFPVDGWHFEGVRANLKRDASFRSIGVSQGSKTHRPDYRVVLNGENACARLKGLGLLKGRDQLHTNVMIDHRAPHCESMQLFKNIVSGTAKASFEGKIYVHRAAQKTDAFQLNNNLLLSEGAQAYSKPNLEIFADDVKASHGSTVGQLDLEQLFYLKTRGIADEAAKSLLLKGYAEEILLKIPVECAREWMECRVQDFFSKED